MAVLDSLSQFTAVNLLAVYIVLLIFQSIVQLVQAVRSRQERLQGLYAVSLIGWVSVFSLLTGFSIGWIVSITNSLLGLLLLVWIKTFRIPIAVAALVSILLAPSLRGSYIPAMFFLYVVLGICVFTSLMTMIDHREKRADEAFSLASLSLVACLAGFAFYFIPGTPFLSKWIAIGAALTGCILFIFLKYHRVTMLEIIFASLLCFSIFLP